MNTLDYLESLEPPQFLSGKSAWIEHIPFVPAILKMVQPTTFVELGSHHGDSYLAFCQSVKSLKLSTRCFAVDTWKGDEHAAHYGEEVYGHLCSIHHPLYSGFSSLLRMTFDEAASNFPPESVDLLHIDGLHTYEAVKHDFDTWRPKLSKKAIVLFHDTNVRERDFGVWKFWAEISSQFPSFEFIHGHGLGILGVGSNLSPEIQSVFSANHSDRKKILHYFSRLGGFLTDDRNNDSLLTAARVRERELFEQNAAFSNQISELTQTNGSLLKLKDQVVRAQIADKDLLRNVEFRLQEAVDSIDTSKTFLFTAVGGSLDTRLLGLASAIKQQLITSEIEVNKLRLQNRAVAESSVWRMSYPIRVVAHQIKKSLYFFKRIVKKNPTNEDKLLTHNSQVAPMGVHVDFFGSSSGEVTLSKSNQEISNAFEAAKMLIAFGFVIRLQPDNFEASCNSIQSIIDQDYSRVSVLVGYPPDIEEVALNTLSDRFSSDARVQFIPELEGSTHVAIAPLLTQLTGNIVAYVPTGVMFAKNSLVDVATEVSSSNKFEYWVSGSADVSLIVTAEDRAIALQFGLKPLENDEVANIMATKLTRVVHFWKEHGSSALKGLVFQKLANYSNERVVSIQSQEREIFPTDSLAVTQYRRRFLATTGLNIVNEPALMSTRLNVITDSFGSGSFYGGVGTALLFAVALANHKRSTLRLITRSEKLNPASIADFLTLYGLSLDKEIEFACLPPGGTAELGVGTDELFLTTSWWTTACILNTVPPDKIIYLLQEDERMFYPHGDDRLFADSVMNNQKIKYVINTKLLFDHLVSTGMKHLSTNGTWFEPAFPKAIYAWNQNPRSKRRFLFYARPNNSRNLYNLGIDIVEKAVSSGLLKEQDWDIYFVGKDIPDLVFGKQCRPIRLENLSWADYAQLVGTIDVALSLMYTPHPSYPPLDLAASGAVVVTNRYGVKTTLDKYSKNILCAEPDTSALLHALSEAIALAADMPSRQANFNNSGLGREWHLSFQQAMHFLQ